jgi:2-methylcitrate dehydratase PrpD
MRSRSCIHCGERGSGNPEQERLPKNLQLHTKTEPPIAPLTQAYADFAAGAPPLPPAAAEVAVLGFTDSLGVMLAGAREPVVAVLTRWAGGEGGRAAARLVSSEQRLPAGQAALVNATAAHALDYDDFAFSNHPSAVLVPAILAAADASGASPSGGTMLRAYAIGYEIWADAFLREADLYYDQGWHPTSILGTLGAAAAASVVCGLDATRTRHALALAASGAGGVFENFGTMAKPWHGGRTAAVGVTAAQMALAGLAASPTAIEGGRGMLRAFSPEGNVDLQSPLPAAGDWRIARLKLNIKRYPVVGAAQRGIDAALALRERAPVDPTRIRRIVARVSRRHAAVMPYHLPQDALQAKFSLQFALACALVRGSVGLDEVADDVVREPLMQQLMAGVEMQLTDEFEPGWRDAAPFDQILVHLEDGRVLESPRVRRPRGHADAPLSAEEVRAKFMACARHAGIGEAAASRLHAALQALPALASAAELPIPVVTAA